MMEAKHLQGRNIEERNLMLHLLMSKVAHRNFPSTKILNITDITITTNHRTGGGEAAACKAPQGIYLYAETSFWAW